MTTDLLSSTPRRQSVRRCLFGKPDKNDEFTRTRKQVEHNNFLKFKRKWQLDDEDSSSKFQWFSPDKDIPEFYTRGYPHKCKRRAVRPCVGKQLAFREDSEENSPFISVGADSDGEDHHTQYVQYVNASRAVEVFIGMRLSPQSPPSPPVAPTPVRCTTQSSTTSPPPSQLRLSRTRSVSQSRLTDLWPIRKRARSLTPDTGHPKRDRLESL